MYGTGKLLFPVLDTGVKGEPVTTAPKFCTKWSLLTPPNLSRAVLPSTQTRGAGLSWMCLVSALLSLGQEGVTGAQKARLPVRCVFQIF